MPPSAPSEPSSQGRCWLSSQYLLLGLGLVALATPTAIANFQQSWSTEQGQQGPIVLALGLWLLWRRWPMVVKAGSPAPTLACAAFFLLSAAVYVLGRVSDQFLVETYGLYGLGLAIIFAMYGARGLRSAWFPLAYLILALPAPYTLTWLATTHLRLAITEAVVSICQNFGLTIVRDGLNILVDQYQLAVEDACSGMNSLISLSAVGLMYIYIRRSPPWWYIAFMILPIFAFAILGNFVRIVLLVLVTHFFGDALAQSYLHEFSGLVTFGSALFGVIAFDALLARLFIKSASASLTQANA